MENEVPTSQPPLPQPEVQYTETSAPGYPDIEALKAQARELAIQQFLANKNTTFAPAPQSPPPQPVPASVRPQQLVKEKVVYVRRNLTVAELILVFAIACGITGGIPGIWGFVANKLPQIEIKVK